MSERAYAEQAGLSRGAVQKARKTGRLVLFADGSINAAASDARRGSMTDPDQQIRSRGGLGAGGESPMMAPSAVSGPSDSTSYIKARTALTVYQAQERQLSIQKKKGVLVDRARAETLVFRLARQERDTWVTWPTRVAALMAAQLPPPLYRPLSTLHDHRYRGPCKTRFRLVGCTFAGRESNPLDRCERFQVFNHLLPFLFPRSGACLTQIGLISGVSREEVRF